MVVAIRVAFVASGWCIDDDLFFIPDDAEQMLQADHHDVFQIKCRSEERVREFVIRLAAAGYKLPAEPPDSTFTRPAWVGCLEAEPGAARNRPGT